MKKIIFITLLLGFTSINTFSQQTNVSHEVLIDIIRSIPNSVETSALIKDLNAKYNNELSVEQIPKTFFQSVLLLGMYEARLDYATIFGQKKDALKYLKKIKELYDIFKKPKGLNYQDAKKQFSTKKNINTLVNINQINLDKSETAFFQQRKYSLLIIKLTGTWLEAMYMTSKANKTSPDESLEQKIAEQKIILEQLLLLLSFFDDKPNFQLLIRQLNDLQEVYENVKISYEYDEANISIKKNMVVVDDNTSSSIKITQKELNTILQIIEKIRNKIIG